MSRTTPRRVAMLNVLHQRGPMTCLEIERALGMPQMDKEVSRARGSGQIASMKKVRLEPVKYKLTHEGYEALTAHLARQNALARPAISQLPPYVPPRPAPVRAGSLDAFALPSRGIGA